jgi:hypothetical protein
VDRGWTNSSFWVQESMRNVDCGQVEHGSVLELGVHKFRGRTNFFGCANSRVARRSEPLDPGTGEPLDQNPMELSHTGSLGFERI